MGSESNLVAGPNRIVATDTVELVSHGSSVVIRSQSDDPDEGVHIDAPSLVTMTCGQIVHSLTSGDTGGKVTTICGTTGSLIQCAGPPVVGPRIEIKPDSIELAIGPPGLGTSISLSVTGIKLQCGLTSFKLSPTGIEEIGVPGIAERQASATGHKLTSAASSVEVGPVGVTLQGPIVKETADGMLQIKTAIEQLGADAVKKDQAAITMLG